jgi:hypothetical protein
MNNRIKELMAEADRKCSETRGIYDEILAELIVRECIQVCEPVLDEPYEDMSEFGKGLVEGQDVAVEKIKRHFGVKE